MQQPKRRGTRPSSAKPAGVGLSRSVLSGPADYRSRGGRRSFRGSLFTKVAVPVIVVLLLAVIFLATR